MQLASAIAIAADVSKSYACKDPTLCRTDSQGAGPYANMQKQSLNFITSFGFSKDCNSIPRICGRDVHGNGACVAGHYPCEGIAYCTNNA